MNTLEVELQPVELQPIADLVNTLRNTSSSNKKIDLLKQNADVPYLRDVLFWTYNPYLKYGVSKKMIEQIEKQKNVQTKEMSHCDFFAFLQTLANSNINNDLRQEIAILLNSLESKDIVDLVKCILTKDLKIGMASANINKAIPNLIPVFDVMRGQKYSDHKHSLKGKEIIITEKIDGVRTVVIIDENGDVKFYSRQGKEIEGLVEIEKAIKLLGLKNIVLDGETTILDQTGLESKDVFKKTMEIMGSKLEQKIGLLYNVFDCMPLSAFKAGICKTSTRARKKYFADKYYEKCKEVQYNVCKEITHVRPLPVWYDGKYDENVVKSWHGNILSQGGEGVMINVATSPYECKRTANLLKVKEMYTMDLEVIGFEEGLVGSKFEGTLGAVLVDYKGYQVKVGSGFTDEEREFFWEAKADLIGRVVEVQYFEETKDAEGNLSLRFPVFVQLREKGKEVSYD